MSQLCSRNHPGSLLIKDFEGIADKFFTLSIIILPVSGKKKWQQQARQNSWLFRSKQNLNSTHLTISCRKVDRSRDPFPSASTCICLGAQDKAAFWPRCDMIAHIYLFYHLCDFSLRWHLSQRSHQLAQLCGGDGTISIPINGLNFVIFFGVHKSMQVKFLGSTSRSPTPYLSK